MCVSNEWYHSIKLSVFIWHKVLMSVEVQNVSTDVIIWATLFQRNPTVCRQMITTLNCECCCNVGPMLVEIDNLLKSSIIVG